MIARHIKTELLTYFGQSSFFLEKLPQIKSLAQTYPEIVNINIQIPENILQPNLFYNEQAVKTMIGSQQLQKKNYFLLRIISVSRKISFDGKKSLIHSAILNQLRIWPQECDFTRMNKIICKDQLILNCGAILIIFQFTAFEMDTWFSKGFFQPELEVTNNDNSNFFQLKELDTIKIIQMQRTQNSNEKKKQINPQNKNLQICSEQVIVLKEENEEEKVISDEEPLNEIIVQQKQFIEQLLESDGEN